jgi:hypothetical protein
MEASSSPAGTVSHASVRRGEIVLNVQALQGLSLYQRYVGLGPSLLQSRLQMQHVL